MKTTAYNPSPIEVEFAKAFADLTKEVEGKLKSNKIVNVENRVMEDNPVLVFKLEDKEGDIHEIVVKFIQRADVN